MTVVLGVCDLCSERGKVRASLVAWRSTALPFGNVDRCDDEAACRQRIEARGEEWPLLERKRETV